MNLLFDANLSWRLPLLLSTTFPKCKHVEQIDLPVPAKDIEIWNWARLNDYIIVTNDDDFFQLLIQKDFPPKVVLLKVGNQSTKNIKDILSRNVLKIQNLHESPDLGILEIY